MDVNHSYDQLPQTSRQLCLSSVNFPSRTRNRFPYPVPANDNHNSDRGLLPGHLSCALVSSYSTQIIVFHYATGRFVITITALKTLCNVRNTGPMTCREEEFIKCYKGFVLCYTMQRQYHVTYMSLSSACSDFRICLAQQLSVEWETTKSFICPTYSCVSSAAVRSDIRVSTRASLT